MQVTYKDINRFSDVFKDIINSGDKLRTYSGSEDTGIAYLAEAFIGDKEVADPSIAAERQPSTGKQHVNVGIKFKVP